jgi:hypothetical protein
MHSKLTTDPGWVERRVVIRPKTRLTTVFVVVWCVVSVTPADLISSHMVSSFSIVGIFCWLVVLLNPLFFLLALYFRLTEQPKIFNQKIPDPNYDLEHLD